MPYKRVTSTTHHNAQRAGITVRIVTYEWVMSHMKESHPIWMPYEWVTSTTHHTAQRAGITVRMLTGDSLLTAKNIAKECGILTRDGTAMEGPDFRKLAPHAQQEVLRLRTLPNGQVQTLQVLARCSPQVRCVCQERCKNMERVLWKRLLPCSGAGAGAMQSSGATHTSNETSKLQRLPLGVLWRCQKRLSTWKETCRYEQKRTDSQWISFQYIKRDYPEETRPVDTNTDKWTLNESLLNISKETIHVKRDL